MYPHCSCVILMSQMRKLRPRDIQSSARGYTRGEEGENWDRSVVRFWICHSSWWKCQVGNWTSEAEFRGDVCAEEMHLEVVGIWVEFKEWVLMISSWEWVYIEKRRTCPSPGAALILRYISHLLYSSIYCKTDTFVKENKGKLLEKGNGIKIKTYKIQAHIFIIRLSKCKITFQ